ncbi:hypothetical protein LSH36_270g04006 [Paralvinella palmiformis]|uniref:PRELI/MSF1 domain-containing protein n=1 Tax=Paralvinella palmiformis TaxID=53620 RepID=A0AAD9JKF9_9ANNE|nr:hypothetical protein LSH36_270g04006 [Paralvinella palmiformis]
MEYLSSSCNHPWETVVHAAARKYPNPLNPNVVGVDVIERSVDEKSGVLKSHRLLTTSWGLPTWLIKVVGMEETCYVSEHSEVDPETKTLKLQSRNLTFSRFVDIDEQLIYRPDPQDPNNRTLLQQEAIIKVNGVPMSSYCEDLLKNTFNSNANLGRQAMEWVISHIKEESHGVRKVFSSGKYSL